ncbi:MAG: HEAT repeat domain-containing protein [Proteobacteria bacterium]|nr:HEAT repeat domain-containing protein [Pseudomonadota bacterium]
MSQVVASVHVCVSNAELLMKMTAVGEAGYLMVPNRRVLDGILGLDTIVFGGMFFTLSVGAALTIIGLVAVWIWDRYFGRSIAFLGALATAWAAGMVALNYEGVDFLASSYFLVVPVVFGMASIGWKPLQNASGGWIGSIHAIPVIVLLVLWGTQLGNQVFIDVRDGILLSNPMGRKVSEYYYRYNLYPAESFKSLEQKVIKTCRLRLTDESVKKSLESTLLGYDYLPVEGRGSVDLVIVEDDDSLVFKNGGKTVLTTMPDEFLSRPEHILKDFSSKSDRSGYFRRFTFFSLVFGLPVAFYILLHGSVRLVSGLFFGQKASAAAASVFCLVVGIGLFVSLYQTRGASVKVEDLQTVFDSVGWQERTAALKFIYREKLEIGNFRAYRRLLESPNVQERYWLVKALSVSRRPETYAELVSFLDDVHPNVARQAFYGLGKRGDERTVGEIINRINLSDDWYTQWYAYKALRSLEWKQTLSK